MIDKDNPFYSSVVRLQQELQLKRVNFDMEESRYGQFFSLKVNLCDNVINTFISMPFEHEMHLSEKDSAKYYIEAVGKIPDEQVRILNDIYLGDTTQNIKIDPVTKEIYSVTIKVECLNEDHSFSEEKNMWYVPIGTETITFKITPVKNWSEEIDVSDYYDFAVKSMEKRSSDMMFNGIEGDKRLSLSREPQIITVNVVQDDMEHVFRIKLKDKECSPQWINQYVAFKTKDV